MSGKYPAHVGVTDWIDFKRQIHPAKGKLVDAQYIDHLPKKENSLAKVLNETDYNTWHVGKWHLGDEPYHPENHGFDVNVGGCEWGSPQNGYFSPWKMPHLKDGEQGEYLTDRLTNEAVNLIKNSNGEAFYLNMSYYTVHIPIQGKKNYVKKYEKKRRALGLDKIKTFEIGEHFPTEHKKDRRIKRRLIQSDPEYASMVQSLDESVGRIMGTLKEEGMAEETIIVFTSDNGGLATAEGSPTCNSPLSEGKGWMYEGGNRVPFLVNWPGVTERRDVCEIPITSPDVYPTILSMADVSVPQDQDVDGENLTPILRGKGELDRNAIYWHYPHYGNQGGTPSAAVRMGVWKLIEFFEDDSTELYNLREDVSEKNDLSPFMPEKVKEMKTKLDEWQEEMKAKMPEPNPDCHGDPFE